MDRTTPQGVMKTKKRELSEKPQHNTPSSTAQTSTPRSQKGKRRQTPKNRKKTPKKTPKTTPQKTQQDPNGFWGIKRILKQEYRGNEIWYQVDWDNDEITGQSFPPEWKHYRDVTTAAVAEWQKSWLNQPPNNAAPTQALSDAEHDPDSEYLEETQPAHPAKRRKLLRRTEARAARSGDANTSLLSSSSQPASEEQATQRREIPDSYEYEEGAQFEAEGEAEGDVGRPRAEASVPKDFGSATDTALQSIRPSQSSESSQAGVASSLPDSPSSSLRATVKRAPRAQPRRPKPFLWDEDFEDEVPDSQDQGGSSSFNPPLGRLISASDEISKNTQTHTEASLEAFESRNTELTASSSHFENTEVTESEVTESQTRQEHINNPEPPSAHLSSSITRTSNQQDSLGTLQRTRPGSIASEARQIDSFHLSSSASHQRSSPRSENFQSPQVRTSVEQFLPQSQPSLPPPSVAISTDQQSDDEVQPLVSITDANDSESRGIETFVGDSTESQHQRQEPVQIQGSDWQALEIVSRIQSDSHPPRPQSPTRVIGSQAGQIDGGAFPGLESEQPRLIRVEDTQKSSSNSSGIRSQFSSSGQLPSPPFEALGPSIEEEKETTPIPSSQLREPVSIPASLSSTQSIAATMSSSNGMPPEPPNIEVSMRAKIAEYRAKIAADKALKASKTSESSISPSPRVQSPAQPVATAGSVSTSPAPLPQSQEAPASFVSPSPAASLQNEQAPAVRSTLLIPMIESPSPDVSRGSSVAGATFPLPVPPTGESPRAPSIQAPNMEQDSVAEPDLPVDMQLVSLDVLPLGKNEFDVPLPMVSLARDYYIGLIDASKLELARLTKFGEVFNAAILMELDFMITSLGQACSHVGLLSLDFPGLQRETPTVQAKYSETFSTKVIFLVQLLQLLTTSQAHIVILVRPGMVGTLQCLLIHHGIMHCRADEPEWESRSESRLRVTLYPTGMDRFETEPASVIIAFDTSAQSLPSIEELRNNPKSPTRPVPLLSLLVTNSIEHLDRCLDPNLEPSNKKLVLVSCVAQLMDRVGDMDEDEYPSPPDAAKAVAEFLLSRKKAWPLPPMPEIEGLDLSVLNSQLSSSEESSASASAQSSIPSYMRFLSVKRQLDPEELNGPEPSKRRRLTPVPDDRGRPTAVGSAMRLSAPGRPEIEDPFVQVLLKKVTDLESRLRSKEATEQEIREINTHLETRCKDYETSIALIQPKYQEALNERGSFEHEASLARERELQGKKLCDNKDTEIAKLREKVASLEAELVAARRAIATSAIPEAVELAQLKADLEQSKAREAQTQKRLTMANNDLEYVRDAFQTASAKAKEMQSTYTTLASENASFREKEKTDRVRINGIQNSNETAEQRRRNAQLKAQVAGLERASDKMSEELKALSMGRRSARGTSVSRSPRMGGARMSPGPSR